jgi:hypothetical protein
MAEKKIFSDMPIETPATEESLVPRQHAWKKYMSDQKNIIVDIQQLKKSAFIIGGVSGYPVRLSFRLHCCWSWRIGKRQS